MHMRIAIVIERYDPGHGGAERSTAQIVRGLCGRGHEVTVVAGYSPCDEGGEGFRIERYITKRARRGLGVRRFAGWAGHVLREGGFDATLSMTMAVPAMVMQPRGGTVRETLERNVAMRSGVLGRAVKRALLAATPKQRALLALERRTLADPGVRKIVAVSDYVADQLQRHYAVGADRVTVVPNAAELPEHDESDRRVWRERVRRGFNVPDNETLFLFAALNPRLKGVGTLLRALGVLRDRGVEACALLAGQIGYSEQRLAAELRVRDRVRVVGPTGLMHHLYAAADATVLPTYYDPSSKVVIESLMMGTPAISTSFNGASGFIVEGDVSRGLVVEDPGDDRALAEAMAAMTDPRRRAGFAAATAGLAERLSMQRHVRELEGILLQAAGMQRVTRQEPAATPVHAGV